MMFSGQRWSNAFKTLKSKWHGESSLRTGLLEDYPPEIELSEYGRVPSPGSESPSGLLNGDSLSLDPIADLDLFFERIYCYYCEKGLWCIITKWIVELLSLGFTICFSGFFLLIVDWNGLRNAKCGMEAVESGIKPCDLAKEALNQHPLTPLTLSKAIIVGYLGLFSLYWIFCFLRLFAQLKVTLGIRHFYKNSLRVTDKEIQTMPWATILEKIVLLQSTQRLCVVKELSVHDVVMRLMRKENYLIGMLNKGVLAFPIPQWVPGAGSTIRCDSNGRHRCLILTKTLEWTLNWCILQSMFDRNFCVRGDFISNPKALKKRLMVVGLAMLLLSPFLVIFMLVYLFLRHAEQFYNHPSTASSQRWSNLAKWTFREFNEVDHLFKHRMNSSVVHATDYLKQFPSPIISIIAKFISFVSGGFTAILLIIAFLEESLLEGHIFGRNLFWYAAVFGTITAISRAAVIDEVLVLDPEGAMSMVVQYTHYMPKKWRGNEGTHMVKIGFETLFQYTGMMLLEDMASIFLTPFWLLLVVPERVDDILQFVADFTVDIEGVGHVCSFSAFDFQNHGNSNYGSPSHTPRNQRSSQGKMEKSFLSFQISYLSWEPNVHGKQFLLNLRKFRDQKLQGLGIRHLYSTPTTWQGNRGYSRETHPRAGYHQLESSWLIDPSQNNHPYLVDWFYTSRPHNSLNDEKNLPQIPEEEHPVDYWTPPNLTYEKANRKEEEYWGNHRDIDRSQSHLGASTSAMPLFHETILQHHDSGKLRHHTSKSHWWNRSNPNPVDENPQASFPEPPDFNRWDRSNPNPVGKNQASFLEPPDFNRWDRSNTSPGGENQRSFLEPSDFNGWDGSNPNPVDKNSQASFLEPPDFNRYNDNFSDKSLEEQDQQQLLDWRIPNKLSIPTCVDDLDIEMGVDFSLPFDDVYRRPHETPNVYP